MPLYHQDTGKIQVPRAACCPPQSASHRRDPGLCAGADGCRARRTAQYYRFDVAGHWRHVKDDNSALAFTRPMFEFVGEALARGENVLVHCLAGVCAPGARSMCRTKCARCLVHAGGEGAGLREQRVP
jgi:hypothetical protein